MFLVTVGLHAARTASGRRCKEQPVLIKSVTAITRRRQNYSRLELQEVRAKAAMNAVLPRFIKQYRRAPHGCASSNSRIACCANRKRSRAPYGRASSNIRKCMEEKPFPESRPMCLRVIPRMNLSGNCGKAR